MPECSSVHLSMPAPQGQESDSQIARPAASAVYQIFVRSGKYPCQYSMEKERPAGASSFSHGLKLVVSVEWKNSSQTCTVKMDGAAELGLVDCGGNLSILCRPKVCAELVYVIPHDLPCSCLSERKVLSTHDTLSAIQGAARLMLYSLILC